MLGAVVPFIRVSIAQRRKPLRQNANKPGWSKCVKLASRRKESDLAAVASMGACSFGLLQGLGNKTDGVSVKDLELFMSNTKQNLVLIVAPYQTVTLETLEVFRKKKRAARLVNKSQKKLSTEAQLWVVFRA